MKCRNIILTLFLIFSILLIINSVSAENITDDSYNNELLEVNPDSTDVNVEIDADDSSEEVESNQNQEPLSEISSDPLPNVEEGSVSGGVDFVSEHPWAPTDKVNGNKGNITYDVPDTASNIKSAYVYVSIYSGSGGTNYGAYANTSIATANGEQQLGSEYLWTSVSSRDGVNYIVNNHTTRCYSDYMIFYNVTDMLQGLNGTQVSINVHSYPMGSYSFDGRIKLISLFVAWDDGDSDVINYWLNAGQAWTDDTTVGLSHYFNLTNVANVYDRKSTLINVALSSSDAIYQINGNPFFSENEDDEYRSGAYYQYHKWDITNYVDNDDSLEVGYKAVSGAYGPSFKNVISILTMYKPQASISIRTADNSEDIIYPGVKNRLAFNVNVNNDGRYTVNLLDGGSIVNSTVMNLVKGDNSFYLIDPTVRPVTESMRYIGDSAGYTKVNYQIQVLFSDKIINETSFEGTVLYNGYLDKDKCGEVGFKPFFNDTISGDIVFMTNGSYLPGNDNEIRSFTVSIPENSSIVKAFMYVAYHDEHGADNQNMLNFTLNGNTLIPIYFSRDQSNLMTNDSYGVIVYDVGDYIINDTNVFNLNKTIPVGVYPSTLIYMYNTTGSKVLKDIYINNGVDLLGNYGGLTNPIRVDSVINVNDSDVIDAIAYIFANGASNDKCSVQINGEIESPLWSDSGFYMKNITGSVKDRNEISVGYSGFENGSFIVLQQIMVVTKNLTESSNDSNNGTDNGTDDKDNEGGESGSGSADVIVKKVSTKIIASSVTAVYNTNKNLIVTLKDSNGKPVSKATINIVLNGVRKVLTTNAKGQATFAVPSNLVPKTYVASISYQGDGTHIKSSASSKVIIKKATPKIVVGKKTFKAKVKVKKYTIALKDNKGKAMKKVKLTLKVKGKTYKATTNAKGKVTFKITNLKKKGKITAKISYGGSKYFNKVTKSVKITVKK
jgi:hypothetical protein